MSTEIGESSSDFKDPKLATQEIDAALAAGDLDRAEQVAQLAIEISPANIPLLLRLSTISFRRHDLPAAAAWADRAIAAKPDHAMAHVERARIYAEEGDLDAAEASLLRAAELQPRAPFFLRRLAELFMRRKDFSSAALWADKAIAADVDHAAAYVLRARIYLAEANLESAEALLLKADGLKANSPETFQLLSQLNLRRKDLVSAAEWADRAIAADNRDGRSHAQRAEVFVAAGDFDAAEGAMLTAIGLWPAAPGFPRRLAEIKLRRSKFSPSAPPAVEEPAAEVTPVPVERTVEIVSPPLPEQPAAVRPKRRSRWKKLLKLP